MFSIKPLSYDYGALEPMIDEATMRAHHGKHHQAYCDKFNAALEKFPDLAVKSAEELITHLDRLPEEIRLSVRNMGGGFVNHTLFFDLLSPTGEGGKPGEELTQAINQTWGSFENFQAEFASQAAGLFGSGWTFLVKRSEGQLAIINLPNQDSPLTIGDKPLLLLDLWEHAYYLKYQNRRADYITFWWKVVNWNKVNELFGS